jgi:hypothetical protein
VHDGTNKVFLDLSRRKGIPSGLEFFARGPERFSGIRRWVRSARRLGFALLFADEFFPQRHAPLFPRHGNEATGQGIARSESARDLSETISPIQL